jgi:peptide/nickel transport system substrate-binding protein
MRGLAHLRLAALLAVVVLIAAACGGEEPGQAPEEQPEAGATIVHGTTDPPVSYDPSGAYDLPSWNVIYNVHEGLLTIPPGGNQPEPSLAESCDFDDPQTYTCTLKQGVTFHDGSDLTAEDVKFSLDRNIQIQDEASGSYTLLGSLAAPETFTGEEIEVVDDSTVTFHLSAPDATWPLILTTPAAYIVPSDAYTADALQADEPGKVIGTGPYELVQYRAGEQTVLEAFDGYHGEAPRNGRVIIQQFDQSSALKLAVEQGEVDIAYRSLTPTDIADLRETDGVEIVEGNGTEIRYLVFNLTKEPGSDIAVRKAVAMTVDRQAVAENVYNGVVQPLYSQVPEGLEGHTPAWADEYGESPDVDGARQVLEDAGVSIPVDINIWYTPSHYGDASADEYAEIERSLEDSELFNVTLDSTEWEQYKEAAYGNDDPGQNQYPAFQLGWFPDFVDADNYLSPFFSENGGFTNNGYDNKEVQDLLAQQKASTDPAERVALFEEIQRLVAPDVPVVPIFQAKQVAAVREGISGVEETFDPSFQFRYRLISKA